MPISFPGVPANPAHRHRYLFPLLLALIAAGMAMPFAVVRYHNSLVQDNQNAAIDAMREYARRQAAFFEREKRYASSFEELGGEWAVVKDLSSPQPTYFHGYGFRAFVSRAGIDGAKEMKFVDADGKMTGGYALMAVPNSYGYTARFTFYISDPGDTLYYHDLGVKTDTVARSIDKYFIPDGARTLKGM